jgi:hypothetical protein
MAQDAFVSDAVRQKCHQPVFIYSVEKATYIGFDDVVDRLVFYSLA